MAERGSEYDLFISYAHSDSKVIVEPLVNELEAYGLKVWYDTGEVTIGDSITQSIDDGLRASNYGVTILSQNYFEGTSDWELKGLVKKHNEEGNVILPLWYGVEHADVYEQSAPLADLRAETITKENIPGVATEIYRAVKDGSSKWGRTDDNEEEDVPSYTDLRVKFQEHFDPDIGTPVTILSWLNHGAPNLSRIEATKLRDEERGLEHKSGSHGTMMTVKRIDDEPIEGRVSSIHSVSSSKVEFTLRVDESRMNSLPDDRDFYKSGFVR